MTQQFIPLPGEDGSLEHDPRPELSLVGVVGSGLMVTTSVLLGLQSFRGSGHLFGVLGQSAEHPVSAMITFLQQGWDLWRHGEAGALEAAEAALMGRAIARAEEGENQRIRDLAYALRSRREKQSRLTKSFVEMKAEAAADQAGRAISRREHETLKLATDRAWKLTQSAREAAFGEHDMNDPRRAMRLKPKLQIEMLGDSIDRAWALYSGGNPQLGIPATRPGAEETFDRLTRSPALWRALDTVTRTHETVGHVGYTPTEAGRRIRGRMAVPVPTFVNPMADNPEFFKRIALDDILVRSVGGAQISREMLFGHSLVNELEIELRSHLERLVKNARSRTGQNIEMQLLREGVSEGHEQLRLAVSIAGRRSEVEIPLSSPLGTFQTRSMSSPVTGKFTMLFEHDILGSPRTGRPLPLARADEIMLQRLPQYFQKVLSDATDTLDPEQITRFVRSFIVEPALEESSPIENAPTDSINKALQVKHVAADIFHRAFNEKSYRDRLQRGMDGLGRMESLFTTGARFFSVDTEFISQNVMDAVGLTGDAGAAGKVPYEIGGTIFEGAPQGPRALGAIRYTPQLFNLDLNSFTPAQQRYLTELQDFMKDFNRQHARMTDREIQALMDQVTRGSLRVSYEGQDYVLWGKSGELTPTKDLPAWMQKRGGETLDRYYLRIQNELLTRTRSEYAVGQNIVGADLGILQRLYRSGGMLEDMHPVFQERNLIDVLDIMHVLSPNSMSSFSLGNVTARFFGLREDEYIAALEQVDAAMKRNPRQLRESTPEKRTQLVQRRIRNLGKTNDRFKALYDALAREAANLPGVRSGNFSLHTAELDAFTTARFVFGGIWDAMRDPGLQGNAHMVRRLLGSLRELGGNLDFLGEFSRLDTDDDGEGLYPFLSNQQAAAERQASLLAPSVLPFYRLQNPVRQLYQRIKPKRLLRTIGLMSGGQAGRFESPSGLGKMPEMLVRDPRTGQVHRVESAIFGGHGQMSEARLSMVGGWEGSRQLAVETFGAYMPLGHELVAGSKMARTPFLMEATNSAIQPRQIRSTVNAYRLMEGLEESLDTSAREMGLASAADLTPLQREHLEQIHYLNRLLEEAGPSEQMVDVIERTRQMRLEAAAGERFDADQVILDAFDELRMRDDTVIGPRGVLFEPASKDLLPEPMRAKDMPHMLGLSLTVRIEGARDAGGAIDSRQGEVVLTYIADPGPIHKFMIGSTVKSGAMGWVPNFGGGLGIHFAAEAAMEKPKRLELAGFVNAHVSRLRRQAVQELLIYKVGTPEFEAKRADVIKRLSKALAKLAGGARDSKGRVIDEHYVRKNMIEEGGGLDRIQLRMTADWSRAVEEVPLIDVMDAMKEMGLTAEHAFKMAEVQGLDREVATKTMTTQLEVLADKLKERQLELYREQRFDEHDLIDKTIRRIERATSDLHNGLTNEGALWDFYVDPQTNRHALIYHVLADLENIQEALTGSSRLETPFERLTGRATNQKKTSLLSSTLLGHAATFGFGGRIDGDYFKAWLASKSGATSFSDVHFQEELERELRRKNIRNFDRDKLRWDQHRRAWVYEEHPGVIRVLELKPMASLTAQVRARVGLLGMIRGTMDQRQSVTGHLIGDPSRVLTITYDGETDLGARVYSAAELTERYGAEKRALMHEVHRYSQDPDKVSHEIIKRSRANKIFFRSPEEVGQSVLFSDQFDFLRVQLYEGFRDTRDLSRLRKTLEKAGVDEHVLERLFISPETIERSLLDQAEGDPIEEMRLKHLFRSFRAASETDILREIILPTQSGALFPSLEYGGDFVAASLGKAQRAIIDNERRFRAINDTVMAIYREAQQYGPNPTSKQLGQLRQRVEHLALSPALGEAFGEVQKVFQESIYHLAGIATKFADEAMSRYLGGRYAVSANQLDTIRFFRELAPHVKATGTDAVFREKVASYLNQTNHLVRKGNRASFEEMVDRATESLESYIRTNQNLYGEQYHRWRGMGALEGFISTDTANEVLKNLEQQGRATWVQDGAGPLDGHYEVKDLPKHLSDDLPDLVDDATDLKRRIERELLEVRREIHSPGSTRGLVMMNIRQPDFASWVGYEFGQHSALDRYALLALGKDPDQIHLTSNALVSWSRREDFDFDLNFMAAVDNPVVSSLLRETKIPGAAAHLTVLNQIMSRIFDINRVDAEGVSAVEYDFDNFYRDGKGRLRRAPGTRVFTPWTDEAHARLFDNPIGKHFGFRGSALGMVPRGEDAVLQYAVQQSVVGTFGGYAKRGAFQVAETENAFLNAMETLLDNNEDDRMRRLFGQADWDFLTRTAEGVLEAQKEFGKGAMFDVLHQSYLAQGQIAQMVAIEKYKGGDALPTARRMEELLKGILGRSRKYNFDDAFESLLGQEVGGLEIRDFYVTAEMMDEVRGMRHLTTTAQRTAELRQRATGRARRGLRLQHDMALASRMIAQQGMPSSYLAAAANVTTDGVPLSQRLDLVDPAFSRDTGRMSMDGAVNLSIEAAEAVTLRASPLAQQALSLMDMRFAELELALDDIPIQRSFRQVLGELPIGAKGVMLAAGAAAVMMGIVGDVDDGPEYYDLPQGWPGEGDRPRPRQITRGTRLTTQRMLEAKQRMMAEASFRQRPLPSTGQQHQAGIPPPRRSSF